MKFSHRTTYIVLVDCCITNYRYWHHPALPETLIKREGMGDIVGGIDR
jgi:hypothetical protein